MSDIISDINKRISEAESARDAARAELESLKKKISNNHIVFHDGIAYVFVGTGKYTGFHCPQCPFVKWEKADSYNCAIGRDAVRCSDYGGRYYRVSEVKGQFREKLVTEDKIALLEEKIARIKRDMAKISEIAVRSQKSEGDS